jgi:hypothetical protein
MVPSSWSGLIRAIREITPVWPCLDILINDEDAVLLAASQSNIPSDELAAVRLKPFVDLADVPGCVGVRYPVLTGGQELGVRSQGYYIQSLINVPL